MDIHFDTLLGFPNVTIFTCYQKEGFIILELELTNQGINCPHCQTYTDKLHLKGRFQDKIATVNNHTLIIYGC
ncbi:hypothetical protein [Aphanothece sacrum]|uniref:Transposase n=1 Tax=Aphanothece sacrum FPU1 TaxID=1920663 RepID=A0A401IMC2_APHSA|nr:hypothetical protein [Aphanothece sacrum]GBF82368.1 transposase [Aphanothece sacrum FPU1]GBF84268.1 transposase [Aphanothece sacrum FPU3]